jgi:hypothetical protein
VHARGVLTSCSLAMAPQKHRIDSKQPLKYKKRKTKPIVEGSEEDIRLAEVSSLIRVHGTGAQESSISSDVALPPFARFAELEVDILELSSRGFIDLPFYS